MRLDEYGRWVSDDGAYIWDETAQVWQPATVSVPLPPPPSPLGAGDLPGRAGGQPDWQIIAGSSVGQSWPDPTWGAAGEASLPLAGQPAADPVSTWSQPADPMDSGSYPLDAGQLGTGPLDAGALGTGSWPVQPADPLDSGSYPLEASQLGTGSWPVQPADPLTDTGASPWSAGHDTSANALWQSTDSAATPGWPAAEAVPTEAISPSTDATPVGYQPTPGYASTSVYPTGEWSSSPDSADKHGDAGLPAAGTSTSLRSGGVPDSRGPLDVDGDGDGDFDEPRYGRFGTLARSRSALLGLGLVAVTLLGFLTVVLLRGGGDSDQQAASDSASGRYEEEFRRSYLDTCIHASNGNAEDYCSCTLAKFEADYTQDEFVRLSSDPSGAESLQAVREVTESCRAGQ